MISNHSNWHKFFKVLYNTEIDNQTDPSTSSTIEIWLQLIKIETSQKEAVSVDSNGFCDEFFCCFTALQCHENHYNIPSVVVTFSFSVQCSVVKFILYFESLLTGHVVNDPHEYSTPFNKSYHFIILTISPTKFSFWIKCFQLNIFEMKLRNVVVLLLWTWNKQRSNRSNMHGQI